jgi:hypothetical protein
MADSASKPAKGTVSYWPQRPPQVGERLIGKLGGEDFMSSRIVSIRPTAGGLEVETQSSRYLAVLVNLVPASEGC